MTPQFSLSRLVRNALLLRVGLAILIHLVASDAMFAPDQTTYHQNAVWLTQYWSGETVGDPSWMAPGPKGYFYVVAVLYSVFGAFPIIPKLANALLGALTVPLVHDIAERVGGQSQAAARAATYAAYFPSLILWSALNIRDVWVIVLILVVCREALVLQQRFSPQALLVASAALVTVVQFRSYIFVALAGPTVVSFLVRNRLHLARNLVIGTLLTSVAIYGNQTIGSERQVRSFNLEEIQNLREGLAVGAGSSFGAADISTPAKAAMFLPIGLANFLLAPFPWTISGVRPALTLPEMLFFYSLIPSIIRGIRTLVRERLRDALIVLLITAGLTLGYALGEGNAGTAYRHRAQVICFYLIFAAAGIEAKRASVRQRHDAGPTRLPA